MNCNLRYPLGLRHPVGSSISLVVYAQLQHTATHRNTMVTLSNAHTATHCNTLQHTATHYNTLQHTTTHYNTLQHTATVVIYVTRLTFVCDLQTPYYMGLFP